MLRKKEKKNEKAQSFQVMTQKWFKPRFATAVMTFL